MKERELESCAKELQQEWERLKTAREESLGFGKKQLEQLDRERLDTRRQLMFWQKRVQEQEACFVKKRERMNKGDLDILYTLRTPPMLTSV